MEFPDYAFPSHANVKGVRGKIPAAEDQPRPPIRLRPCPLDAIREMLTRRRANIAACWEHTARPVLPKAPGVWKYATLQNLTLDEL